MFAKVKRMMPVSGDGYDREIVLQIKAAALDLTRTAEIILPGTIDISIDGTSGAVTDNSTVEDEYLTAAIACWCAAMIGNPPNHDNMMKAYEAMKGNMRLSREYTDYGEACGWRS